MNKVHAIVAISALGLTIAFFTCPISVSADVLPQDAGLNAWRQCTGLQNFHIPATAIGLPTTGALVTSATFVSADRVNSFGEYCLVDGEIAPREPRAQKIKFSVAMPTHWNRKMVQLGGGGFDGRVISPNAESDITARPPILARGYVCFGSDSGHDGELMDASFALNEEQLRNFAGEQLKKAHDAVIFLVQTRYGVLPVHSYFIGESEGGREGFTAIQQYPDDYDGVVALFPPVGLTQNLLKIQLISRALRLNHGAGWISKAKATLLRNAAIAACDRLDGLEDSIISNVDACRFDFAQLRCASGKDTGTLCFSDVQLETLRILHSDNRLPFALAGGETTLPAYPIGTDFGSFLADSVAPPTDLSQVPYFQGADTFVRYVVMRDPKADTLAFDPLKPGKWRARVQELSQLLDRTSLDIDRFQARGGKLILIQGRSDPGVAATATIAYYQNLVGKYGQSQTDRFLRFYLIPGYGHGAGISFDARDAPSFDALEEWVERGVEPQTLTVVDANPEAHGRSRPICAYPAWPKYNGVGDPSLATSFSCVRSD